MRTIQMRAAFASLAIAALFALGAGQASAQGPTPEGTVISNTATASFTDANGNTYTDVQASVDVTVGYQPGATVSISGTTTPPSPSASNVVTLNIANNGNGTDQFSVTAAADAGLTISGFEYNGNPYADEAALNVVLAGVDVAMGGDLDVDVIYSVATGQGGNDLDITLTATSVREPLATGASDSDAITISPTTAYAVAVTADAASVDNLPSNGGNESITFDVENTGSQAETFDLDVTVGGGGANVAIVSVNGTGGAAGTVALASGANASVTVVYTVNDVPGGTVDDITLTATSQVEATVSDADATTINVERPTLVMAKVAYRDDQVTPIGAGEVLPGEFFWYRIDLTNNGGANASSVEVSDPLAPSLIYDSAEGDVPADWTISEAAGTVTATLDVALAPAATRTFWIRVQVE